MPVPASPTTVNDLTPVGNATRVAHSAIGSGLFLGNAASFDGTCNFDTTGPNLSALSTLPGPYAIEFWLQSQGVPPPGTRLSWSLFLSITLVPTQFTTMIPWCSRLSGTLRTKRADGHGSIIIPTDDFNWHHVLYVFYGSLRGTNFVDGYLDGVLWPNISGYNMALPLSGPIIVGNYNTSATSLGWIGREDEVAIDDWTSYTKTSASLLSAKATAMVNDHIRAATVNAAGVTIDITQQPTDAVGLPVGRPVLQ